MKLLKTLLIVVLVGGVLLGTALPALAASSVTDTQSALSFLKNTGKDDKGPWSEGKVKVVRGEVKADPTGNVIVIKVNSEEVSINVVPDKTRFKVPTLREATLSDIKGGMQVVAQVYEKETQLYARHIMVIPGKPQYRHHVGKVTAYMPGVSITIQPRKGDPATFQIVGELKVLPRGATVDEGDWVTVISRRNPANDQLIAFGVVVHRLEGETEEVAEED